VIIKLSSGNSNDFLFGGVGNDFLDGGDLRDTAIYYGKRQEYDFLKNGNGSWKIRHVPSRGSYYPDWGTDTLVNIEVLQFDDAFTTPGGTPLLPTKRKVALSEGQDIVIAIDLTRSMDDNLTAVEIEINQLLATAFGGEDTIEASRIAVVTYTGSAIQTLLSYRAR
jgi:hypothetical protein